MHPIALHKYAYQKLFNSHTRDEQLSCGYPEAFLQSFADPVYQICKINFLSLAGISEPHNEGDTSTGTCHEGWMGAHLHFRYKSGKKIHAVLIYVLLLL